MVRPLAFLLATLAMGAAQAANVGQAGPDFILTDVHGKAVKLSDFKEKTVVLKWVNPGCPFVQKHYNTSNMQTLQKDATGNGVVWLSVNSTEKGHQDYIASAKLDAKMNGEWKGASSYLLMDEFGKVGQAYMGKTTPHMYVIDGSDDKRRR